MIEPEGDDFELDGPQVATGNTDDVDLDAELGLSKKPTPPALAPEATNVKIPAAQQTANVRANSDGNEEEDEEDASVDEVSAAAASAVKWFDGFWSAASNAVANAAENVQKNQDISRAFKGVQEAFSSIHPDKLLETVASVSEATNTFKNATLASIDKVLDVLDPIEDQHIFDENEYNNLQATDKVKVIVTSANPTIVATVVEVFERLHGTESIFVKGFPSESAIAKQPVGWDAALQGAKNRVNFLLQSSGGQKFQQEGFLVVGFESFVVQIAGSWFDATAVVLHDTKSNISMHTFSQLTPVDADLVQKCLDLTPPGYSFSSTGASVTVSSLIALTENGIDETTWQLKLSDNRVGLNQILFTALLSVCGQFWRRMKLQAAVSVSQA